jgi:hypothetical protein
VVELALLCLSPAGMQQARIALTREVSSILFFILFSWLYSARSFQPFKQIGLYFPSTVHQAEDSIKMADAKYPDKLRQ